MKQKLIIIFFIALLSSCSSIRVIYDFDSTINFNNYSTFAFSKQEMEKLDISDIDKQIKKEIDDGIIAMPDAGEYTREIK